MKYGLVELPYHERTFKHASQVRCTKTHPIIFSESSMTVRRTSCSPLSLPPVLKWYKILMSALWISFSWNLAKALKVCELGDMHEKENRKMRWRQEASLMKYILVIGKNWKTLALLWYLYVYFIVVAYCYKRFVLCIWMHWWAIMIPLSFYDRLWQMLRLVKCYITQNQNWCPY